LYVWGDARQPRVAIYCNDKNVMIRQNLHAGLVRLRLVDSIRTIWVDAICINQKDSDEKSWQVPLMAEVFSGAVRVVAWLGAIEDTIADTALHGVELIVHACGSSPVKAWARVKAMERGSQPLVEIALDLFGTVGQSLQILFTNSWFRRVWYVVIICQLHAGHILIS
jgi:hypothetical protein